MAAIDECGAPAVSIAGGEPLLHRDMPQIVQGYLAKKKFVILCTNALLMKKKIDDYQPSPYFTWSIHLDGDKAMHDKAVDQAGTYDTALEAIHLAKARGFRVQINCTVFNDAAPERLAVFMDHMTSLGVEVTISPGYAYERAADAVRDDLDACPDCSDPPAGSNSGRHPDTAFDRHHHHRPALGHGADQQLIATSDQRNQHGPKGIRGIADNHRPDTHFGHGHPHVAVDCPIVPDHPEPSRRNDVLRTAPQHRLGTAHLGRGTPPADGPAARRLGQDWASAWRA